MKEEELRAYMRDEPGAARRAAGEELEREACALIKQYGLFLPAPAKSFFRKLADFLQWHELKGILK